MSEIIPGLVEQEQQRARGPYDFQEQLRRDRLKRHQREADREKGRMLLEALRYKSYVSHHSLTTWLQTMGNGVKSRQGPWFWLFVGLMLYGYIGFSGWVL